MMRAAGRKRSARARDGGFIIVAVLWIVAALATLALIYTSYVVRAAYAVGPSDDRVNAEALFTAAIELTAYQLTAVKKEIRPPNGRTSFRMGRATVVLEFHSESARIDLNVASKELLANLFVVLGAKPADADQYVERVIGWRSRGGAQNGQDDTEAEAYRAAGRNYKPRRGPFQDVGELWLVVGIPPVLVDRALPYVTVYSGQPRVNILDASPMVLAALPGVAVEQVKEVLAARQSPGANGQAMLAALGQVQGVATIEPSRTIRVLVGVQFDSGTRAGAEIVILVSDDAEEPYRVLSWRDDFDQIAPAGR
jgi:general secretion pathway protein K